MESLVASSNKLGVKILHAYRNENPHGNVFYSPASIAICLGMLNTGAKEDTKKEIEEVLSIEDSQSTHERFGTLLKSLQNLSDHVTLNITNILATDQKYKILPEFHDNIKVNYNAEIRLLPIESSPKESRSELNRSIEEATNGKIKELFTSDVISSDTKLVLANAIYFKGNWNKEFNKINTEKRSFYTIDKKEVTVDMMRRKDSYNYIRKDDLNAEMLEIPYLGGRVSLIILLPFERYGLPLVENNISVERLNKAIREMRMRSTTVLSFPKFKLEESLPLKQCLLDMGMKAAFTPNADFSGISGERNLLVSSAMHKGFLDINEEGTEAAAATFMEFQLCSANAPRLVYFTVDHPFMLFIRDSTSGLILFYGSIRTL